MATVPVVSRGIGRKPPSDICTEGGLAFISLTKGFEAVIDIADLDIVIGYRWVTLIHSTTGHAYAVRYDRGRCILMHRELLNAPVEMQVDHEDGDGLNNRRNNIRLATPNQNQANRAVERRNKLGAKGVSPSRTGKRFRASITPNGRKINLGSYATKEEAAAAYHGAAKALWGDFAYKQT